MFMKLFTEILKTVLISIINTTVENSIAFFILNKIMLPPAFSHEFLDAFNKHFKFYQLFVDH